MNRLITSLILVSMLAVSPAIFAADNDLISRIDESTKALVKFEYGQNANGAERLEDLIPEAAKDPQLRAQAEDRLLRALASDATVDGKALACRHLVNVGSVKCVPVLEPLLTDARLSHPARYALARIADPAACEAMLRATAKTTGVLQVGMINSLGDRRFAPAVPELAKLLSSSDPLVAGAAAAALGKTGGADAVKQLEAARAKAPESLRKAIDNGLIVSADLCLAAAQNAEATRIYKLFYRPETPKHLRLAALRGLVAASGADGVALVVETIKGADKDMQRSAIGFVPMSKGANATKAFADLLPSLPPGAQELLVRALTGRGDAAAAPAITALAKSSDDTVRVAALEALGVLGNASSIAALAQAAADGKDEQQQVARASLVRLPGADVDAALMAALASGEPKIRVEYIRALAGRNTTKALADLLKAARDEDAAVRREAIKAIGALAGEAELPSLIDLAVNPKSPDDRAAVENAVADTFRRVSDPEKQTAALLVAYDNAPAAAKVSLVRLLTRAGTPKALTTVRTTLKDSDPALQDAAARTLADWPSAEAAEDLLQLASKSANNTHRVLALRGYVRLAGLSKDPTAMYARAMELAASPDDKRLVLAGLGTADSVKALDIVEKYLKDDQLKNEAALAAVAIADKVRGADPARASATIKSVLATATDARVKQSAAAVLGEMQKYEGYILRTWQISGPYTAKDKEAPALFDMAFAPEKPGEDAKWKPLDKGIGAWQITLDDAIGGGDNQCAYMRTRVISPVEQDVVLEFGSDDAIKGWLNGKVIVSFNGDRGVEARQNVEKGHLKQGENDLLLKVINHSGGWGFCCRIRSADGAEPQGLKYER
ncbi:MAG: HEAT repeat domain-containing protein [Tepidisphaeraceae bacterium]